jgi:hypothetical protein
MSESEQKILHLLGRPMGLVRIPAYVASRPALGSAKFSLKGNGGRGGVW